MRHFEVPSVTLNRSAADAGPYTDAILHRLIKNPATISLHMTLPLQTINIVNCYTQVLKTFFGYHHAASK